MAGENDAGVNVPFETVYTTNHGYIARQLKGNAPGNLGLTWRLWLDASSEVILPLSKFDVETIDVVSGTLAGYRYAERFQDLLKAQKYQYAKILDLNFMFNLLVGVVRIQQRVCDRVNWAGSWFVKMQLLNVWRSSPFLDSSDALDGFEKYGVPMCLDERMTIPPGSDPETFAEIVPTGAPNPEGEVYSRATRMFVLAARALGLPSWDSENSERYVEELMTVGNRATVAQGLRNRRNIRSP